MTTQQSTFLVTGAGGFVGSNLAAHLAKNLHARRVIVFDLPHVLQQSRLLVKLYVEFPHQICFVEGDVTDKNSVIQALTTFQVDVIFHLAAIVSDWANPNEIHTMNVIGTRTVLDAAKHVGGIRRVVVMSSVSVFDYHQGHVGTDEDAPMTSTLPINAYAKSKIQVETMIKTEFWHDDAMDVCIVRPGLLPFGEGDDTIFLRLANAIAWRICPFAGLSDGPRLCVSYIGNLVDGLVLVGTVAEARNQVFCLTDDETPTWGEFVTMIANGMGSDPPLIRIPVWLAWCIAMLLEMLFTILGIYRYRPFITRYHIAACTHDLQFSNAKAKRILGWKPRILLREAVARSVMWYAEVMLS